MKTLGNLQKISSELADAIASFNDTMPEGYFISTETDGRLLVTCDGYFLVTCDEGLGQMLIPDEWLGKESLTLKDIEKYFESESF